MSQRKVIDQAQEEEINEYLKSQIKKFLKTQKRSKMSYPMQYFPNEHEDRSLTKNQNMVSLKHVSNWQEKGKD